MSHPLDYSNPTRYRPLPRGPSVGGIFLFISFYALTSFVIYARIPVGIHQMFFGHSPGDASMLRYGVAWVCFTLALIVAYGVWLHRYRRSWLLAPILGVLSFVPGIIACAISLR